MAIDRATFHGKCAIDGCYGFTMHGWTELWRLYCTSQTAHQHQMMIVGLGEFFLRCDAKVGFVMRLCTMLFARLGGSSEILPAININRELSEPLPSSTFGHTRRKIRKRIIAVRMEMRENISLQFPPDKLFSAVPLYDLIIGLAGKKIVLI